MEEIISELCNDVLEAFQTGLRKGIEIGFEAGKKASKRTINNKIVFF